MTRIESIARIILPWFNIIILIYTYVYVDNMVFESLSFISYFYLSILLSILLRPDILSVEDPTSLRNIVKSYDLTLSMVAFSTISIYAFISSGIKYQEILYRVVLMNFQYILVNYIGIYIVSVVKKKNIILPWLLLILFVRLIDGVGDKNLLFANIVGGFFYLSIISFQKGYQFVALGILFMQIFFLFIMKRLSQWKVEEYIRSKT